MIKGHGDDLYRHGPIRANFSSNVYEFTDFIHSIEQLIGNPPETDEWLDNEAVCKRLGISKRTLQSYRDTGKIPFSMIGHKCYYKESDITELLNANNE